MSNHAITLNTNLSESPRTRADFTYKISPTVIAIADTGLSQCPVLDDIEAVFRKIEYWHQGSIATFKIMYRNRDGFWTTVRWDGQNASVVQCPFICVKQPANHPRAIKNLGSRGSRRDFVLARSSEIDCFWRITIGSQRVR